jgi:hypothetical protein
MRSLVSRALAVTVAVAAPSLAMPCGGEAQTANVTIQGRIQSQFSAVSGDSTGLFNPHNVVTSSFDIRRLRIQANVRIGENINLVIQPSFEMGALRMRDAYLRVLLARTPTSSFGLTLGQEKKPFNRYELTSSNTLPSIERGARFRGLATGVVPAAQSNLLEDNGYLSHDLGASADVSLLENRVQIKAGIYNGAGESANDVNNAKTFGARATATVLQDAENRPVLRLGAAFLSRDRAVTTTAGSSAFSPDSSRRTNAVGLEVEWGDFRPGPHVIADFATGKALTLGQYGFGTGRNLGNVRPNAPDSAFSTFRSLQVVAAYRVQFDDPSGTRLIKMIEPAIRLDMTDPNTGRDNDQGMLLTPVLNVYFSQSTVLRAGVDLYSYRNAAGDSKRITAVRLSWQTNF